MSFDERSPPVGRDDEHAPAIAFAAAAYHHVPGFKPVERFGHGWLLEQAGGSQFAHRQPVRSVEHSENAPDSERYFVLSQMCVKFTADKRMPQSAVAPVMARVQVHDRAGAECALSGADVIFEGVPETLEAKRHAFSIVSEHARPDAIVASTTSTILSDSLQEFVTPPGRFLNAHWLNPAYLVPLVELSPGKRTDPAVTAKLKALLEGIGKVPVVCTASPGYIVPRIQALAMNEAARLVEEGVATAEDIDKATRYGFGFRFAVLGLLEFIDWGGGDILYYASRYMKEATGEERFAAPRIIEDNMVSGNTGLRARRGFLDYSAMDVEQYQRERLAAFVAMLEHMKMVRPPVI